MMSKFQARHYEEVAASIRLARRAAIRVRDHRFGDSVETGDPRSFDNAQYGIDLVEAHLMEMFLSDNERFNPNRFGRACQLVDV